MWVQAGSACRRLRSDRGSPDTDLWVCVTCGQQLKQQGNTYKIQRLWWISDQINLCVFGKRTIWLSFLWDAEAVLPVPIKVVCEGAPVTGEAGRWYSQQVVTWITWSHMKDTSGRSEGLDQCITCQRLLSCCQQWFLFLYCSESSHLLVILDF